MHDIVYLLDNAFCFYFMNLAAGRGDRLKRPKLDFSSCAVEEPAPIPKNLVQIAADENEIQRRIQCFVEKKREEIDLNNIMDYTAANHLPEVIGDDLDEKESTCARTNSVIVKQEDSKCHLRVRRVKNRMGPQIRPDYLQTLDKLMSAKNTPAIKIKQEPTDNDQENFNSSHGQEISSALQQRLSNVEEYLHLRVINTKHVYERIKAIENRILHLESISPEYKHFFTDKFSSSRQFTTPTDDKILAKRKVYSVDELDSIIEQMKQNDSDREEEKYPLLDET